MERPNAFPRGGPLGSGAVTQGQRYTLGFSAALVVAVVGFGLPSGTAEEQVTPAEFTPSARAAVSAGLTPESPPTTSSFLAPAAGAAPLSVFPDPSPAPTSEPQPLSDPGFTEPSFEPAPAPQDPAPAPKEPEDEPATPSPLPVPVPVPVPLPLP